MTLLLSLIILSAADYSGKYKGELESAQGRRQAVYATIKQQGNQVSGSIGPTIEQQVAFEDVSLVSGKLSFRIAPLGGLRITFLEASEHLDGTVTNATGQPAMFDRASLRRIAPLTIADLLPPLPNEGKLRSPRIAQLRSDIDKDPSALSAFWEQVRKSGAPIVEPDPIDSRFVFATFLWQGQPEHKNVLVLWQPFAQAKPADHLMLNVPNTNLWFRTLRVPRNSRIYYSLSPNDPLAAMPPLGGPRSPVKDPLNPKGDLLDLVAAQQPDLFTRRDGASGFTVQERILPSAALKQDRRILVYTPPGYDPKAKPYPTVYFFDGEDKDGTVFSSAALENDIARKHLPALIAVRIVNPNQGARTMLSGQPPFFEFLSKELVPFIRANFNVSAKPEETAISGYSLGGFAAAFAGLKHSDLFGLVLSQSGSFWFEPTGDETAEPNWLAQQFINSPKLPLRFYMDAGLFELDLSGRGSSILLPNRHLRDVLRAKGYEVKYQEFPGGHNHANWRDTLPAGLVQLFAQSPR